MAVVRVAWAPRQAVAPGPSKGGILRRVVGPDNVTSRILIPQIILSRIMLRVGLTGGIGSGKSTVRDLLARKGAGIFDADKVARRLMQEDATVRAALEQVLGSKAWLADGTLNKTLIADRIFGDAEVRDVVNGIVHPAVQAAFEDDARAAQKRGVRVFIREAALLPSSDQRKRLDRVVAVLAPRAVRLERVQARDGMTVAQVEERMQSQPSESAYLAAADDVIRNGGTRAQLEQRVDELWEAWLTPHAT